MTLADATDRITGTATCYSRANRLVSIADLNRAGITISDLPEGHSAEHVYVAVAPEIADELTRRLGEDLPDHGVLVDVLLYRHESADE